MYSENQCLLTKINIIQMPCIMYYVHYNHLFLMCYFKVQSMASPSAIRADLGRQNSFRTEVEAEIHQETGSPPGSLDTLARRGSADSLDTRGSTDGTCSSASSCSNTLTYRDSKRVPSLPVTTQTTRQIEQHSGTIRRSIQTFSDTKY